METKKNNVENLKNIIGYFKYDKALYIFAVILRIIGIFLGLYATSLLGKMINLIIAKDFSNIANDLIKLLSILLLSSLCRTSGILMVARLTQKIMYYLRGALNKHVQKLEVRIFEEGKVGELISLFINDIPQVSRAVDQSVSGIILSLVELALKIMYITYLSWILGGISLIIVCIIIFIIFKLGNIIKNESKKKMESLANVNSYAEEIISNQIFVKQYLFEEEAKKEFAKKSDDLKQKNIKVMLYSNLLNFISSGLINFLSAVSIFLGAYLSFNGYLTVGALTIIIRLVGSLSEGINALSFNSSFMYEAFASDRRIKNALSFKEEIDEGNIRIKNIKGKDYWVKETKNKNKQNEKNEKILSEVIGEIEFKNVDYSYKEENKKSFSLRNINFKINKNETLAIVGKTGAGKSTIINLIARFYEIQKGNIYIDGIDIKSIRKKDLRGIISLVLQDINLFTGTVYENVKYGNLEITKKEVEEISEIFGINKIIEKFEEGLDTKISSENTNMSEGEKQIISILRAAVSNPKILIFDEATSKIDTITEKSVQKGIENLKKDKINIIIAHRLSTIRNSKTIMVLDKGEIKEIGSHDELIDQKGIYYKMHESGKNDFDLKY